MTTLTCTRCKAVYATFRKGCPHCGLTTPNRQMDSRSGNAEPVRCASCDGVRPSTTCPECDEPLHKGCMAKHRARHDDELLEGLEHWASKR